MKLFATGWLAGLLTALVLLQALGCPGPLMG
jgi:hypothetical protein